MTMEQRAFIAVVLMAAILIIYQTFLVPTHEPAPPPQNAQQQAPKTQQAPAPAATPQPAAAVTAPALPSPVSPSEAKLPQRITRVTTPLYDTAVSSEGGKFQEFVLRYRGEKPMVIVGDLGPTGLVIAKPGSPTGQVVSMQPSADAVKVGSGQPTQDLVLTGSHDGLRVRETLTFRADSYEVAAKVRVENTLAAPQSVTVALPCPHASPDGWTMATRR